MNINPLDIAALCAICAFIGYTIGKAKQAKLIFSMIGDLSYVLDLHLLPIETEHAPLRKH
jgi:hypothetical protein